MGLRLVGRVELGVVGLSFISIIFTSICLCAFLGSSWAHLGNGNELRGSDIGEVNGRMITISSSVERIQRKLLFPHKGKELNKVSDDHQIFIHKSISSRSARKLPPRNKTLADSPLNKVDIDKYLMNTRAVMLQIKCVIYDGPCDSVGKEIKRLIPMVLNKGDELCTGCDQKIVNKIKKVIAHLQQNYPEDWKKGNEKYGNPPKYVKD